MKESLENRDFYFSMQESLYNKINSKASHFSLMFLAACGMLKKGV